MIITHEFLEFLLLFLSTRHLRSYSYDTFLCAYSEYSNYLAVKNLRKLKMGGPDLLKFIYSIYFVFLSVC